MVHFSMYLRIFRKPMKKVYCIGELLIDFVAEKQGSDLSKANEFTKKAGGAPANVACAISKLGGNGVFIGCVGKDPFGKFLLETLKEKALIYHWRNYRTLLRPWPLFPLRKMENVILFLAEGRTRN